MSPTLSGAPRLPENQEARLCQYQCVIFFGFYPIRFTFLILRIPLLYARKQRYVDTGLTIRGDSVIGFNYGFVSSVKSLEEKVYDTE